LRRGRQHFGRATGRQVAMLFSCTMSILVIIGYIVLRYMKLI
jgi:hypothetical protein